MTASHDSEESLRPATNPIKNWVWFVSLAVVGSAIDLWTKAAVFSWLGAPNGQQNIYWLIPGYVGIETSLNHGALFGMGQGKVWFFVMMSFIALIGITVWLARYRAIEDWLLTTTLGVVCGGIIGNLYDRLGIWSDFKIYAVRDWIRFSYDTNAYVWPNFNIADSLLVCGAALLVWHAYQNPHPEDK